MKYNFLTILPITILLGCAEPTLIMNQTTKDSLKGKTITYVEDSMTSFSRPQISGGIQFIGNLISSIYVTSVSDIKHPREHIRNQILPIIVQKYHMKYIKEKVKKKEENSLDSEEYQELDILKELYTSDYLLAIDTYDWIIYASGSSGIITYNLVLRNNLRLIERESQKIISSINCEYMSGIRKRALFDNNAKLFKEENQQATQLCIEKIKNKLL